MAAKVEDLVGQGKAFTGTTDLNSIANSSEHPYLYLNNPSSSGKPIMVTHGVIGVDATNVRSIFKFWKNPTVSANGTAVSIVNTWFDASAPASVCQLFRDPTVTSNGTLMNMKIKNANSESGGINRIYWLSPGNSILITVENSVGNADTFADIYWVEDP